MHGIKGFVQNPFGLGQERLAIHACRGAVDAFNPVGGPFEQLLKFVCTPFVPEGEHTILCRLNAPAQLVEALTNYRSASRTYSQAHD